MILVAPAPKTEFYGLENRIYKSDHRQIIYDVDPADIEALTTQKCVPTGPDIVVNHFPEPVSIHCFACGAFIEKAVEEFPWQWLLTNGAVLDFFYYHYDHARYSYIQGWKRYPPKTPEQGEPSLPSVNEQAIEERVPLSVMTAGMDLSGGTFVNRKVGDRKAVENVDYAPNGFIPATLDQPGQLIIPGLENPVEPYEGQFLGFEA